MSPLPIYHLRSLRIVLPVLLLIFAGIAGGAGYFLLWRVNRAQYEKDAWENALVRTTELQSRVETWMQRRDPQMVQSALSAQTMRIETTIAILLDDAGKVVAATRRELAGLPLDYKALGLADADIAPLQTALKTVRETHRGVQIFTTDRNALLAIYPSAQPLQPGELLVRRDGIIFTAYDLRFVKAEALAQLRTEFGVFAAGILVLALGLGASLHFLVTRRLDGLHVAMKHFAAGQTIEEMKPRLNDEIAQLKTQFNDMARKIGREITERREAEQRVREHETKLTLAMSMARLADWEYDVDSGMFTFDESFYRLLNTTSEREGGTRMPAKAYAKKFLPAAESDVVAREIERAVATDDPNYTRRLEQAIVRADGSEGVVLVQFSIGKDTAGRTVTIYGVIQDITERVQAERQRAELERQLREVQKMDAIGTLAGGIAHDFNNILTGIIAFTELSRMDAADNENVQSHLKEVLRAANRASQLVRQILSFSRRAPQERKIIPVAPVVREALKLLRSTLPSTIQFEEHIEADLPPALVDSTQIHQVVMNLCTNAGHAMQGRQGRLVVRLESQEIKETRVTCGLELRPGAYVRLSVADTGVGMSEETMQRLFEPFFTTKGPGEGTGLGLPVVHSIVKGHDGAITVDTRVGEGTTFGVYLPVVTVNNPSEPDPGPDIHPGKGERILFIDDEVIICSAAASLLERHGYRPTVFSSSEEAWRAISAAPNDFDAVVTDLTMPVLTGVDLAGRIRDLRPGLPVILTSGFSGSLKGDALKAVGVRELVLKPIDFRRLTGAIHRALNGNAAR